MTESLGCTELLALRFTGGQGGGRERERERERGRERELSQAGRQDPVGESFSGRGSREHKVQARDMADVSMQAGGGGCNMVLMIFLIDSWIFQKRQQGKLGSRRCRERKTLLTKPGWQESML